MNCVPQDFSTTDRFCWELVDGRQRPTRGKAVWHLLQGPFAYADFRLIPGSLVFNVPPGP